MVGKVNTSSSSSSSSSYTYSARSYVPAQPDSKQRKRIMHRSVPKGYTSTTSPELRDSSHTPIHGPVPDSGQGDNPWANQALYHSPSGSSKLRRSSNASFTATSKSSKRCQVGSLAMLSGWEMIHPRIMHKSNFHRAPLVN
jgi:hypothetical protein